MQPTSEGDRPRPPAAADATSPELAGLVQLVQEILGDEMRRRIIGQQARPLRDHLADYRRVLDARGNGGKHNRDTWRRVRLLLRLCRASRWRSLSPSIVQVAAAKLLLHRDRRRTLGLATANHYLHSLKAFCRWMVSDYRADRSPCEGLRPYNASLDVRRPRRRLTPDELEALIEAARAGRTIGGIPGEERAMIYTLMARTGLRVSEIESLTRNSFRLGGTEPPTVTVEAAYSKHRRRDVQPLHSAVARELTRYLAGVHHDGTLFRTPRGKNSARGIQVDLEAAGIPYRTGDGYADHHALRHTFISELFDTGATPKEAQSLARHQDARMTLGRYAHVSREATQGAIERLAPLPAAGSARRGLVDGTSTPRR